MVKSPGLTAGNWRVCSPGLPVSWLINSAKCSTNTESVPWCGCDRLYPEDITTQTVYTQRNKGIIVHLPERPQRLSTGNAYRSMLVWLWLGWFVHHRTKWFFYIHESWKISFNDDMATKRMIFFFLSFLIYQPSLSKWLIGEINNSRIMHVSNCIHIPKYMYIYSLQIDTANLT